MNRAFLKIAAAIFGTGLVVVPFLGLDSLPRDVRRQIAAERTAFANADRQIKNAGEEVKHDLQAEPELFRGIPASRQWDGRIASAAADLQAAARQMEQLSSLEKANRRSDGDRALTLLRDEKRLRTIAEEHATAVSKEADHWVEMKRQLPETLRRMDADYKAIHAFDISSTAAQVQKAETDWPDKRTDLDARLGTLQGIVSQSDTLWNSSAEARRMGAAGNYASLDFAGLLSAAETLHTNAAALPAKSSEIQGLTAQLYKSWDKVLVDLDKSGQTYKEKVRTITTPKDGQAASDEQWVEVSQAKYDAQKNNLGMAIEHKPLGKFDFEAERTAQPAGFAYMAPPGQRNQYGYWDDRGGHSFWVFYGQYALMRDLLFNHSYQPLPSDHWYEYRDYRSRGQTYYGRDYGTNGASTQQRYQGSGYAKSGGFKDSKYASKSGSFKDSQYASPQSAPKRFGSGSAPSAPRYSPPSPRPSPRPSFRPPSGRRFGRR